MLAATRPTFARACAALTFALLLAACANDQQQAADPATTPPPTTGTQTNTPPEVTGTPATTDIVAGTSFSFVPNASDADGDPLTFSIENLPVWATFDTATGAVSGTPTAQQAGTYDAITISVSDGKSTTRGPSWKLVVSPPASTPPPANRPPVISGAPAGSVITGQTYTFAPTASDPDGNPLTFSISNKPAWASFDAASGRLTGTPATTNVGTNANIIISVSDGSASASLPAFSIVVQQANRAPTISGVPSSAAQVGVLYSFIPSATDPDRNALSFAISNKPAWATFNTSTGELRGTPAAANVGSTANIVIAVSDGSLSASLPAFTLSVTQSNRAPTISGTPATSVKVGAAYAFTPTASDPDGTTLTFSIANKPAWASFSTATGALTGTPAAADAGTYSNVVITASDGTLSTSLAAFTITVQAAATGSVTLSWTAPTTRTDGTALTDLAGYWIYYGTTQGTYPNSIKVTSAGVTTYVVDSLASGTYFFAASAYDTAGNESVKSTAASVTVP